MDSYPLTKNQQEACIEAIKQIVAIPSVLDEKSQSTPFGQDIQKCLEETLSICSSLGLETYLDDEGYYGYAEIGEGKETLAVLCHLDVVPADNEADWTHPPFEPVIDNGKLYGRGTQDDKGPSIITLFALKALIDAGYTFNKKIRFIFGTDEETLWRCMDKYNKKEEKADLGFAPDSKFPLIYAEKGLWQLNLTGPGHDELALNTGAAFNVVPDKAIYTGDNKTKVKEALDHLEFDYDDVDDSLIVKGKSIHSKDAPKGINAVTRLAKALGQVYEHPTLTFLNDIVNQDPHATNIFGELADEASGKLTFNVAKIEVTPTESKLFIDVRLPVTADKEELERIIANIAQENGLTYQEFDYLASLYVPKDSELVQTLLAIYRERTGDQTEPISSGGATYARMMDNCVCFGARLPETPDLAHQVDEYIPLENIYESLEIYAETLKRLACQ